MGRASGVGAPKVRKCRNAACWGAGKLHRPSGVLCPSCWRLAGIVFAGLVFADLLEAWRPSASWAFALSGAAVLLFWMKANEKASGKPERADVPSAGRRVLRWGRAAVLFVLVFVGVMVAKAIVVGATLGVFSMLR